MLSTDKPTPMDVRVDVATDSQVYREMNMDIQPHSEMDRSTQQLTEGVLLATSLPPPIFLFSLVRFLI